MPTTASRGAWILSRTIRPGATTARTLACPTQSKLIAPLARHRGYGRVFLKPAQRLKLPPGSVRSLMPIGALASTNGVSRKGLATFHGAPATSKLTASPRANFQRTAGTSAPTGYPIGASPRGPSELSWTGLTCRSRLARSLCYGHRKPFCRDRLAELAIRRSFRLTRRRPRISTNRRASARWACAASPSPDPTFS